MQQARALQHSLSILFHIAKLYFKIKILCKIHVAILPRLGFFQWIKTLLSQVCKYLSTMISFLPLIPPLTLGDMGLGNTCGRKYLNRRDAKL